MFEILGSFVENLTQWVEMMVANSKGKTQTLPEACEKENPQARTQAEAKYQEFMVIPDSKESFRPAETLF